MNRKRMIAAVMAAVMVLGTAGCGSSEQTTEAAFAPSLSADESVTLNIIGYLSNFEALEAVINDFNEYYPNCEVLYSCLDDYSQMLETRLRSDTTVDIFMGNSTVYAYDYVAGACADLASLDIDLSAIQDDVLSAATADGKLYTLPLAQVTTGMAVNETLLEENGLRVPTNYSELLEACEALLQAGYTPIQGYSDWMYQLLVRNMIFVQLDQSGQSDDIIESMSNAEDGCGEFVRDAYEIAYELTQLGYIVPDVNNNLAEDNYNGTLLRFLDGDVPFLLMNSETFSGMKKRETKNENYAASPFAYSFRCIPLADDDCYSYIENWSGFSVNAYGENQEWAVEFMRFLATEEQINQMASVKGLPSVAKNSDDDRFDGIFAQKEENQSNRTSFVPIMVENAINRGVMTLGTDGNTVDEAIAVMESELKNPSE